MIEAKGERRKAVRARLEALAAALSLRAALAAALFGLAVLAGAAAIAFLLARWGLLAGARFAPLVLWLAFAAALVLLARRIAAALSRGTEAVRAVAFEVEREQTLRRGALVGLVDLSARAPVGSSAQLIAGAEARLSDRLGSAPWAPRYAGGLTRRVRYGLALLAGTLVLAGWSFSFAGDAAASLVSPLAALRAAIGMRVRIAVSQPLVKPGDSVLVTTASAPGSGSPVLYLRRTGEPWRPVRVTADARGAGSYLLRDVRAATFVYASAAGRVSETLSVRVLEPLVLGELAVRARYPAYLDRPEEDLDPAGGPLNLPVGTVLKLHGAGNEALARAALVSARDTVVLVPKGAGFDGELPVRSSARWQVTLTGQGGATLGEPPVLDVVAVPDSAPVVTVPVPGGDTTMALDLKAQLMLDLRDDHALGRAEVVSWRVSRLGVVGDSQVDPVPGVAGADRLVQSQLLDATHRSLLPGDTLRYFVRAWDQAPTPHLGRSRDYALRLLSMSELREAVRTGADTLSRAASSLAGDQSALSQRTQDLAAQRDRSQDRVGRPQDARPQQQQSGSDRARDNTGTEPFEQREQSQQVLDQQRALVQRADSLRGELERLMHAAEQAGINDPSWQQKLRELDDLLRQAMTPELRRELEALQQALERLDPRAVQEALRRLVDRQQELRDQLQRSAELFERAALEGSMQTFAQNAQQLQRDQQEWADRAPERRDSAAAAADEQRMRQSADSLRAQLQQLRQRLEQRGDSATERGVEQSAQQTEAAGQSMQQAGQSMQGGQRQQASRSGNQAAQQLQQIAQQLSTGQQQMSAQWRNEVEQQLELSTQETVQLASEEQRLAQELRRGEGSRDARGRQSAMEQGINQVLKRLESAAGRNALVSPRLGAMMSQARSQVSGSREALEGPSPSSEEAADRAAGAAQSLSSAAMQMLRNAQDVAGAQSGSGYQEAVQRLAQLAGQQGALNDQLGMLLPQLGAGQDAVMQQLRQLAERQRGLANQLERLGETGVGDPRALADEARQLADRIEQARLDRATLERQQRLFRRMLDAGRTLRNDEETDDPERKSRTAEQQNGRPESANTAHATTLRYPMPAWTELKQMAPGERAMVLDYFRRLNEKP